MMSWGRHNFSATCTTVRHERQKGLQGAKMTGFLRIAALLTATSLIGPAVQAQGYDPRTGRYQEMNVQDQPGYIPQSEEVPAQFKRQAVFFRTTEPPGT